MDEGIEPSTPTLSMWGRAVAAGPNRPHIMPYLLALARTSWRNNRSVASATHCRPRGYIAARPPTMGSTVRPRSSTPMGARLVSPLGSSFARPTMRRAPTACVSKSTSSAIMARSTAQRPQCATVVPKGRSSDNEPLTSPPRWSSLKGSRP